MNRLSIGKERSPDIVQRGELTEQQEIDDGADQVYGAIKAWAMPWA